MSSVDFDDLAGDVLPGAVLASVAVGVDAAPGALGLILDDSDHRGGCLTREMLNLGRFRHPGEVFLHDHDHMRVRRGRSHPRQRAGIRRPAFRRSRRGAKDEPDEDRQPEQPDKPDAPRSHRLEHVPNLPQIGPTNTPPGAPV
jgi:hypothetical protein